MIKRLKNTWEVFFRQNVLSYSVEILHLDIPYVIGTIWGKPH